MSQENNFIPNQKQYKPLGPFKLFVKSNFPFIEATFEALDNYGLYCKIVEYLNTVISNENEVEENVRLLYNAFVELNNYVSNYFDNLDVQEEINNKLDDMVEQGTLQEIIADYLNSKAIFGFDTVNDMKNATNLINGSYAKTLGFYSINDGGSALYKIRNVTNDDVIDEMTLISLNDEENSLIAELIYDQEINLSQLGCYGDGTHDDSEKINTFISNLTDNEKIKIILLENKSYRATININTKVNISFDGFGVLIGSINFNYSERKYAFNEINNITINNESLNYSSNGLNIKYCYNLYINNVKFRYCNKAINFIDLNQRHSGRIVITKCMFQYNNYELYNNNAESSYNGWQVADIQFLNNQLVNTLVSGIYLKNVDGLICKNNVFFFAGYQAQDTTKEYNIFIYHCNFTLIEGNNLFEAGYDSIRIGKFENLTIQNNTIDWGAQRVPGAGIYLYDKTNSEVANSLISNNVFNSPSKYGIDIQCFARGLTINANTFVFDSSNDYYYGSETIDPASRRTIHLPDAYKASNVLITNNNYYNWLDDVALGSTNASVKVLNNLTKNGIINRGYSYSELTDSAWGNSTLNLPTNDVFVRDRLIIPASRTIDLNIYCIGTPIEDRIIQIINLSSVAVKLKQAPYTKTLSGEDTTIIADSVVTLQCYNGIWYQI